MVPGDMALQVIRAVAVSSVRELGLMPSPSNPEAFSREVKHEYARWGELVKGARVKAR
jgi:tripartite-type tricarboxylate transporter receptor subunit TctC